MPETISDLMKFDKSPQEGQDELKGYADDWSGAVTSLGIQATYAIIAANWAVRSSPDKLLSNLYATISIGVCIAFLMVILLLTEVITEWLRHRWQKSVDLPEWWRQEWDNRAVTPWPYTAGIQRLARWLRYLKAGSPIVAGFFFILSLFCA